jgi:hypothetical protein
MRFGVNVEWLPNVIFQQFAFVGGLTPAVSLGGTFEVHFLGDFFVCTEIFFDCVN